MFLLSPHKLLFAPCSIWVCKWNQSTPNINRQIKNRILFQEPVIHITTEFLGWYHSIVSFHRRCTNYSNERFGRYFYTNTEFTIFCFRCIFIYISYYQSLCKFVAQHTKIINYVTPVPASRCEFFNFHPYHVSGLCTWHRMYLPSINFQMVYILKVLRGKIIFYP